MKNRFLLGAVMVLTAACTAQNKITTAENHWRPIFNGKNLDGWTPKFAGYPLGENYKNTFRVEDGKLLVSYDQYSEFQGEFGHLFYREKLSHYRLRFDYRFVGDQVANGPEWARRNNGIMLHTQTPQSMGLMQAFPVSIETQLLGGLGSGPRSTGNMCSPGSHVHIDNKLVTDHCVNSSSATFDGDQWVHAEVEVHGNALIKHIINGAVVFELTEPQLDANDTDGKRLIKNGQIQMSEGYIALQAESHPTEFKNIELMPLKE